MIESYLVIDQTYTRICVRMLFDRSQSISMSGDLVEEGGRCVLYYVFRSEKSALELDSNPPARGAADLKVSRKPILALEGDYWMERGTKGTLLTVGRSEALYDSLVLLGPSLAVSLVCSRLVASMSRSWSGVTCGKRDRRAGKDGQD